MKSVQGKAPSISCHFLTGRTSRIGRTSPISLTGPIGCSFNNLSDWSGQSDLSNDV